MNMETGYELNVPVGDGNKDVKAIISNNEVIWERAIPTPKSGVAPLSFRATRAKPLLDWSITGKTYQAWTPSHEPQVGNNKLDNSKIEKSSTVANFTYTDSSVSFGSMTVGSTINSAEIKSEDTSYAFSFSGDTSKVSFALKCYDSSHTYLGDANKLFDEENRAVMTLLSNTAYIRLVITTTVQGNISLTNLMLNKGNTVMAFEPFGYLPNTGACPVQSVGDKAENLFTDKTIYHNTIGEDSFWYASSTSSSIMVEVQPNTKYYIKTNTVLPIFRIGLSAKRPDVLSKFVNTYRLTNTNSAEITTGDNINYLVFQGSQSLESTWLNELYVGQGYKIDVVSRGKNLWNWDDTSYRAGYYNSDGVWILHNAYKCGSFKVFPGTKITLNNSVYHNVTTLWNKGDFVKSTVNKTIVVPPDVDEIKIAYLLNAKEKNTQVEYGDVETAYEPYIEPKTSTIYLNSPLMADETLDSTGKREVEWGVKVFDGSERIARDASKNAYRYAFTDLNDAGVPKSFLYCSHFKNAEPALEGFDGTITTTPTSTAFRCWIWSNNFDSLDSFKSFLKSEYDAGHPVTVYYKLATPTSETVDVPQIPTLKGNTVLDVDTEVQPSNVSITYLSSGFEPQPLKTADGQMLYTNNNKPLSTLE